jgi:uncharacterized protein YcaQ
MARWLVSDVGEVRRAARAAGGIGTRPRPRWNGCGAPGGWRSPAATAFRKVYDLTERVVPAALSPAEAPFDDSRDASTGLNVAALDRLGFADRRTRLQRLLAHFAPGRGRRPWVTAGGAARRPHRDRDRGRPGPAQSAASPAPMCWPPPPPAPEPTGRLRLLSPFDPALRDRGAGRIPVRISTTASRFSFPNPSASWGYYVFPVLEGDRLVGRHRCQGFQAPRAPCG